jgi:hypothetical protein
MILRAIISPDFLEQGFNPALMTGLDGTIDQAAARFQCILAKNLTMIPDHKVVSKFRPRAIPGPELWLDNLMNQKETRIISPTSFSSSH